MKFLETPIPPQDYQENPYAHLARWREEAPLHYVPSRDLWLVLSYDLIMQLLRDERLTITRGSSFAERSRAFRTTIVRQLRAFFATLGDIGIDAVICEIVDKTFRNVRDAGEADLVGDLAQPIPLAVMGWLLGVPDAELRHLMPLGAALINDYDLFPTAGPPALQKGLLDAYFQRHLVRARMTAATPLMRLLVDAQKEHGVADSVLVDVCARLLSAGSGTTAGMLGNSLVRLLHAPDGTLDGPPGVAPMAPLIDELTRLDTSVLGIRRRALCDFDLGHAQVREGQTVLLMAAAANRDPTHFPNPDTMDPQRSGKKHLSFGHGSFHCLGEPLARKETAAVIEAILPYLSAMEILEAPARRAGWLLHEPVTLRVKIGEPRHAH